MMECENIDLSKLIDEVEKRPAIWDITSDSYKNKILRRKAWEEIVLSFSIETDTQEKMRNTARVTVWIVLLFGIILHTFHVEVMNIAILSMVKKNRDTIINRKIETSNYSHAIICGYYDEKPTIVANLSATAIETISGGKSFGRNDSRLDWSKADRNLVLGGGSWFVSIGQFLAGLLMHRFGVKLIVGLGTIMCAILSFVTPPLAFISPTIVAFIGGIREFLQSIIVPGGVIMLIGKWSPLEERGKFMSVFIAVPLGLSLSFVLFPFICEHIGWPYAFHTVGILSLVWCLSWWYYVYDTPEQHPRIKDKEKNYIKRSIGKDVSFEKRLPIPWKQILTCVPFYIIVSNYFGLIWIAFLFNVYGPTYLHDWLRFSSEKSGIILSITCFLRAVFGYVGGVITDSIIKRKLLSITDVRKIWTVLGSIVPGLSLLPLVFYSCNTNLVVIGIIINTAFRSLYTVGLATSIIDLSPNFCIILQSICSTVSFSSGLVLALFQQFVSENYDDTYTQWKIVFAVSMIIETVPAIVFLLFGKSEVQPWNNPPPNIGDPTIAQSQSEPSNIVIFTKRKTDTDSQQ